ncbi:hypothetical protein [Teredinibacter turnerae]|uniref:hypothetical protein n=1 Tax=Teredinibacter turnerae TaxID=2426 RepID=UPI00039A5AFE|nr:hypothetical protein [Teredinibacter turnerae]
MSGKTRLEKFNAAQKLLKRALKGKFNFVRCSIGGVSDYLSTNTLPGAANKLLG